MDRVIAVCKRLRSVLRAVEGNAAIEFALAAPLLVGILIPVVDFGMAIYQKMEVEDAAQAGAQYALLHGWNSPAIQSAVTGATALSSISASPAPVEACGCHTGTSITLTACGSTCTNGDKAGIYVTVNAQSTYTPLIAYPLMSNSITLTAQSIVRIPVP